VFIFQERRIRAQEDLIASMKIFIDIFDGKKNEEYVRIRF